MRERRRTRKHRLHDAPEGERTGSIADADCVVDEIPLG
jgi:hypothetical protein